MALIVGFDVRIRHLDLLANLALDHLHRFDLLESILAKCFIVASLRLELCGQPVRVIEIAPGMVKTDEFALNRFRGDAAKAAAVYAGVAEPLTDEDVADAIAWTVTRPSHVNIDLMVMRPRAQAAQHKVCREP